MIYQELFSENRMFNDGMWFDFYKYSDLYAVQKFSKALLKQLKSETKLLKNKDAEYSATNLLKQLICNLVYAYEAQKAVIISRTVANYKNTLIKNPKLLFAILDWLAEKEYMGQKLGYMDYATGKGRNTRVWAKSKLIECFSTYGITSDAIKNRKIYPDVIIRDDEKKEISLPKTEQAVELKNRVHAVNLELYKHQFAYIGINGKAVNLYPHLTAIYNRGSFDFGGRLYNISKQGLNYQSLNKSQRATITIDGAETVSLDYSALHVSILYNVQGLTAPEKPYSFIEDKNTAKKVLYRIINGSNMGQILYGLNSEDETVDWLNVINRCKEQHKAIAKYFGSGKGLELMKQDGSIMLNILEHFAQKGVTALPMHDEVIISAEHGAELKEVMQREYRNRFGFEIGVK